MFAIRHWTSRRNFGCKVWTFQRVYCSWSRWARSKKTYGLRKSLSAGFLNEVITNAMTETSKRSKLTYWTVSTVELEYLRTAMKSSDYSRVTVQGNWWWEALPSVLSFSFFSVGDDSISEDRGGTTKPPVLVTKSKADIVRRVYDNYVLRWHWEQSLSDEWRTRNMASHSTQFNMQRYRTWLSQDSTFKIVNVPNEKTKWI